MFPSKVKAKLARNEPVLITCLHLMDATVFEIASHMGFDGIWVDMEHHVHSVETVQQMFRAARMGSGSDIMARPAKGEYTRMMRMLEAGAHGILYPRCSDADEAGRVVQAMKFHPQGTRGFDGGNRDMPYCTMDMNEYLHFANDNTFLFAQIEEPEAVENVDRIAAVEGVDALFFGPGDFTVMSGIPGQLNHPIVTEALKKIQAAAKRAGIHWGMPVGTPQRARELLDMGAGFVCAGADMLMVRMGLERIQSEYGELGFKFDNQMPNRSEYLP